MFPILGMSDNSRSHQKQQKRYRNILTKWLYATSCLLLWILSWTNLWTLSTDTTSSQQQQEQEQLEQNKCNPTHSSSHSATVIGLAVGYNLETFQRFVGSLRRTGYAGHILVGIDETTTSHNMEITNYLTQQNVTVYILQSTNCTAAYYQASTVIQCVTPYPDLKVRWSKYALAADWLRACATCTGPVLLTDVRDVLFQSNPFTGAYNNITSLQLFAEHPVQSTMHKLVKKPILKCRHVVYKHKSMLCSGTTAGPRKEMLQYLEMMKAELQAWAAEPPHCPLSHKPGGDQAVHNYLYYAGKLPSTIPTVIAPFGQGMVNTAAAWAQVLQWEYDENSSKNNNLGLDFLVAHNVTDPQGYFLQSDGITRSAVVHQFDRFHWAGYDPNWVLCKE